ncbi:MAG TPA: Type 1 glutamine amidotransferase-like domain-containing protein [Patescibacteria group bacterium]|nr:Type 1 glutamine amidotransferase-like domain-containing protein [Patescibacteria group bacterium]
MNGPIGLHGGGEYDAGDEPFLDALLLAGATAAANRLRFGARRTGEMPGEDVSGHHVGEAAARATRAIRVVILPTAAARGRPDQASANGRAAFERRAAIIGRIAHVDVARVVDAASASDPDHALCLADADLIHLPGGDPDLVPGILAGSRALAAIEAAWRRGAVIAGASAGAMALAEWTWTPAGGIRALGLVHGLAVVPHYDDIRRTAWQRALDDLAPGGIGYLGLDERTGVIAEPNGPQGRNWRVAGAGAAWWFARGSSRALVGRNGDVLHLPV